MTVNERLRPSFDPVALAVKVPPVTALLWIIKVLTTGMGETASDFLARTISPEIAVGAAGLMLAGALVAQMRARARGPPGFAASNPDATRSRLSRATPQTQLPPYTGDSCSCSSSVEETVGSASTCRRRSARSASVRQWNSARTGKVPRV